MKVEHRQRLSRIMGMAWDFKREEPDRAFADCLRGAWKISNRLRAAAPEFRKQMSAARVELSPSLIQSPIRRSLTGKRYAGVADRAASYVTSKFGR